MDKLYPKYRVVETNADLEILGQIGENVSKDIAESICCREFRRKGGLRDYMVLDMPSQEILGVLFSAHSMQIRGECQG